MATNIVILNPSSAANQGPEIAGQPQKKSKIEIKKIVPVGQYIPPSPKDSLPPPKPKKVKKPKQLPPDAQPSQSGTTPQAAPKPQKPQSTYVERPITMQAGIVKAVNSGDSVTILEIDEENPRNGPKEIFLTILGLKAPIVGRREVDGNIIPDEPFSWHSREFLRKLVIGKPVVYRIEHTVKERERERSYGELWAYDETDIRMEIVSHGWADVISKPKTNSAGFVIEPSPSQVRLEAAKEEAKERKLGIWGNAKDAIRKVKYHDVFKDENSKLSNDELYALYKAIKDKGPLKAVVENVRNGTIFNVILTDTYDYFTLTLSGVRSPQLKPEQQPFAQEAKYFAEHLILNKDVTVTIDGLDKLSLYGSVILNGSNIALTLLNQGLASFVEWTSKDSSTLSEFKEAEKRAQENRLRMWTDYQPVSAPETSKNSKQPQAQATKENSVTGKVIEIINAGTITVRQVKPDANNAQKTVDRVINLSSIRLPRGPIPVKAKAREDNKDLTDEELKKKKLDEENLKRENIYAAEAKEFLRNLVIGQRVRCVFDYVRGNRPNDSNNNNNPPVRKHYWSVYATKGQSEKNVALELVQQGYAWVVEHSQDELRSADYKDLILAEKAAKTAGKNIHSVKPPRHFGNDLTLPVSAEGETKEQKDRNLKGLLEKCRHFLIGFTAKDKIEAIVDYVFSAGRFKLTLPSNSCTVMFALTGVVLDKPYKEDVAAPNPDVSVFDKTYPIVDKNGQPHFGNLALHYVRDNVFQRKVDVSIKKLDSYGAFIGQLFVEGKDLGLQLIERGYAKIHVPSLRKATFYSAYKNAYDGARSAKTGLWEYHDFEEEERKTKEAQDQRMSDQTKKVNYPIAVTDVRSGNEFSFQILSDSEETAALEGLSQSLQNENFGAEKPYSPKLFETIAAQFTVDDLWYRAEVIALPPKNQPDAGYEVRYLDYGNRETLPVTRIRQLPEEYVTLIKPQAKDARLHYLKAPALDSEFGRDSMTALRELLWDKVLFAEQVRVDKPNATGKNAEAAAKKESSFVYHLIVYEEKKDLNKALIRAGHVKVLTDTNYRSQSTRNQDPYYAALLNLQEEAHEERLGIWQYGADPEDDEEERL